jgi:hypothetical protein
MIEIGRTWNEDGKDELHVILRIPGIEKLSKKTQEVAKEAPARVLISAINGLYESIKDIDPDTEQSPEDHISEVLVNKEERLVDFFINLCIGAQAAFSVIESQKEAGCATSPSEGDLVPNAKYDPMNDPDCDAALELVNQIKIVAKLASEFAPNLPEKYRHNSVSMRSKASNRLYTAAEKMLDYRYWIMGVKGLESNNQQITSK